MGNDGAGAGVKGGQRLVRAQQRGVLPRALIDGNHVPGQRTQRRRITHKCLIARHHHVRLGHLQISQSVSHVHLFQPPMADQMSEIAHQSQYPASHPNINTNINREKWRHSQDNPAKKTNDRTHQHMHGMSR